MNKKILVMIVIISVALICLGAYLLNNTNQRASSRQTKAPEKPQEIPSQKLPEDEKMMSKEDVQSGSIFGLEKVPT